jgi:DnaJ domain
MAYSSSPDRSSSSSFHQQRDPYKVLCVARNFTLEQLRANYKKLALQLHPDKSKLTQEDAIAVFQVLTHCYKQLVQEHELRTADKIFTELKAPYSLKATEQTHTGGTTGAWFGSDKTFDTDGFNRFFVDNKLRSSDDDGYAEWMARNDPVKKAQQQRKQQQVIKWVDPQPLVAVRSRSLAFQELGVDNVSDYSKTPSHQVKVLAYTDYRVAHTTEQLVDPSTVRERKQYNSVQDLEKERARVRYNMNAHELAAYQRAKQRQADVDRKREEVLKRQDQAATMHFQRTMNLLTNGGGGTR